MQLAQRSWSPTAGWTGAATPAQLVLAFAPSEPWVETTAAEAIRAAYPEAHIVLCSGAGQIAGPLLVDDAVVVTAVSFADTRVCAVALDHPEGADSAEVGARLAAGLPPQGLRHVLVFSDGTRVNGTALVRGLTGTLPGEVTVTGGLAADDDRFTRTLVGLDAPPAPGQVVVVGLYGERLRVGIGALGGWDVFGPDRRVTRSAGNVLQELDGQPALGLYKRYLGPFAEELPGSALLFPLALRRNETPSNAGLVGDTANTVVRTVLGIDEATESMTFAGDVPEGTVVRLMKASPESLIGGAEGAARAAAETLADDAVGEAPALALVVSCVGRRIALRQRTEEELEAVRDAVAECFGGAMLAGFYSYGEIAPNGVWTQSELHNQTMTITLLAEA
jgi:hypothetical protein